eukprot:1832283-Amphidinium_carterae.1
MKALSLGSWPHSRILVGQSDQLRLEVLRGPHRHHSHAAESRHVKAKYVGVRRSRHAAKTFLFSVIPTRTSNACPALSPAVVQWLGLHRSRRTRLLVVLFSFRWQLSRTQSFVVIVWRG